MITVVTGPPCSGKTTWVRDHAAPGDIIIDFDELARALGSPAGHEHPAAILEVTRVVWAHAVRRAIELRRPAWIIDSRPRPVRMARYRAAGCRIVSLSEDRDVLHERAREAGRPASVHQQIDDWLL